MDVRYDDFVAAHDASLRQIMSWFGERWERGLLVGARQARVSTHPQVEQATTTTSRERWRHERIEESRDLFRRPAAQLPVELGYARDEIWIRGESRAGPGDPDG
jgi:hypothetical protein